VPAARYDFESDSKKWTHLDKRAEKIEKKDAPNDTRKYIASSARKKKNTSQIRENVNVYQPYMVVVLSSSGR
jgi:hypothetical protein